MNWLVIGIIVWAVLLFPIGVAFGRLFKTNRQVEDFLIDQIARHRKEENE